MVKQLFWTLVSVIVFSSSALAGESWIHIRIVDEDIDGDRVSINMPVDLVESMLPMIETKELREGRIKINNREFTGEDLREFWSAIRKADDGEFLTMESNDAEVRVSKKDGLLLVRAEDRDDDEYVDLQIPIPVVDALLSSDDDELDLLAGLDALQEHGHQISVTVNDDHTALLVWIDDDPDSDR